MRHRIIVACMLGCCAAAAIAQTKTDARAGTPGAAAPRGRALFIVDKGVYSELRAGLERYAAHIDKTFHIACVARPDDYYAMKPPQIRAILKAEYGKKDQPPLVGAIMVGPIPHALKGDPNEILIPQPLFYEDSDAVWEDKNNDGIYQDGEITNDRTTNPTEIWTSWWVPPCPAGDQAAQVKLLNTWLDKLDRYYKDEITGRDALLWLAGNVAHTETCEGWTVLLKDTLNPQQYPGGPQSKVICGAAMTGTTPPPAATPPQTTPPPSATTPPKPLNQQLYIWFRLGQDEGTFRPNKRQEEFLARDLVTALTLQRWQHAHLITHGDPCGWYWDGTGVVIADPPKARSRTTLKVDLSKWAGTCANIVTTSGCSNGNFRGDYIEPAYQRFMGSALLFSPDTATIAYYGGASPQSTGGDPGFCTELIESLRADGDSYLAEGYKKMRNSDYSWGTQHFFFRGGDEKILSGDPFAKYPPQPAADRRAKKGPAGKNRRGGLERGGSGLNTPACG